MSARPKNWPGSTLSWRRLPRAVQRGKRQPFALARRSLPGSGSLRLPPCSSLRHWADAHGQTHTRAAAGSRATGAPAFPRLAAGSGCRCSGYLGDVDCPASRGAACAGHGCVRFRPGPGTSGRALRCPVRHCRVRRPGTGPVGGAGHDLAAATGLLADLWTVGVAWTACAAGWLLAELAPIGMRAVLDALGLARAARLRTGRGKLAEEWGFGGLPDQATREPS